MSSSDRIRHTDFTQLVVTALGNLKAVEAVDLTYEVVEYARDPRLKAAAILAVGKMGAPEYADDLALVLRTLNFNTAPVQQSRGNEAIALACVSALVRFRDPVGFPPVFFASIGWYSHVSQVREKAREALSTMVDDPSDILGEIIANEGDISIKLEALEAEGRSNAPPARKADVAVVALQQGLILATSSVIQSNDLSRLRQRSALMLIENRASNEAAIPLLEQMIYLEHDINERLTGIVALGSNPLDDAARTLTSFLKYQNERQADGLAPKDYRVIRTTIRTLGEIGSPIAQEELSMVRFSGWTPAIIDEAAKALEKID